MRMSPTLRPCHIVTGIFPSGDCTQKRVHTVVSTQINSNRARRRTNQMPGFFTSEDLISCFQHLIGFNPNSDPSSISVLRIYAPQVI